MADDVLILIPARMAATRLPGKPLLDIAGSPMIVHVLRRALAAELGPVVVATDDEAIAACVEKAGGRAVMTRKDHPSGSDRIFEALGIVDPKAQVKIIINMQGDLPTLPPADLQAVLGPLSDSAVDISTIAAELRDTDWDNPNVVKVAGKNLGPRHLSARVFTRTLAPQIKELQKRMKSQPTAPPLGATMNSATSEFFFHHIGLYAYRRQALQRFVQLPPSKNELTAKLEQLRAMDAGMRIDVAIVNSVPLGVDTPEELEIARAMLKSDSKSGR